MANVGEETFAYMDWKTTSAWLLTLWVASSFSLWAQDAEPDGAEPPEPQKPAIEKVGEETYRLGQIEFNARTREIRFPAEVNQEEGILEYVLVHESGKTHESLLRTAISPSDLQVVLKLLRYETGKGKLFDGLYPPGELPDPEPEGADLDVFVAWGGKDPVAVETLIKDLTTHVAMTPTSWILNGSEIINGRFMAQAEGSFIALYLDSLAMINSKHPRNWDDEIWFPLKGSIPPYETPVTVILRPAKTNSNDKKNPDVIPRENENN